MRTPVHVGAGGARATPDVGGGGLVEERVALDLFGRDPRHAPGLITYVLERDVWSSL